MAVDAQYLSEAALRAFQRRQKLKEIDTEGAYDKQDLGEAIRRLAEQRAPALQNTKQSAAKQGLFYSGQLGKQLGEVEKGFARQQGDTQRDFDRRDAARAAARRAIESGAPLEEAAAQAAAADRQIQLDTETADAGGLVQNPAAAAKPAAKPKAPKAPAKPKPRQPRRSRTAAVVGRPALGRGAASLARPARPRR